jgi:large subunit ribosomal protein L15
MLHEILDAGKKRRQKIRVGRGMGSGLGESCGRGQSGAYSRSGNSSKLGFEGGTMRFFRRLPRRGFNNKAFRTEWNALNLVAIDKGFKAGEEVTLAVAIERGLVRRNAKRLKVLGDGELTKALRFAVDVAVSTPARAKIEKAGGTVLAPLPKKEAPDFVRIEADKQKAARAAAAAAAKAAGPAKGEKVAKGDKPVKAEKPAKADKPAKDGGDKAAKGGGGGEKRKGGGDKKA